AKPKVKSKANAASAAAKPKPKARTTAMKKHMKKPACDEHPPEVSPEQSEVEQIGPPMPFGLFDQMRNFGGST
ncbi:unnamed protein product, partial [Prorocentrum cordatum]